MTNGKKISDKPRRKKATGKNGASRQAVSNVQRMPTLTELLRLPSAGLEQVDVALLNFVCAYGLPGAEEMDVAGLLEKLDDWAALVKLETDRNYHKFINSPEVFDESQAYYCVLCMITVLQRQCGVRYNPKWQSITRDKPIPREFGRDARDVFIHAIIDGPGGTCGSLPVLYAAVGRRLGYPLKIVKASRHLFLRWDDPQGKHWFHPVRFNIEATGPGIHRLPDEHYKTWPHEIPDEDVEAGIFLKSLSRQEELAEFIVARAYCILAHGQLADAIEGYRQAVKLAPHNRRFRKSLDGLVTHRKMLVRGHMFLNAPVPSRTYSGPPGPHWVQSAPGQEMLVQVVRPGEMVPPPTGLPGVGCHTVRQMVQLPNGQSAEAEVPLQTSFRPMKATWLRLDGGQYALMHKPQPHWPTPPPSFKPRKPLRPSINPPPAEPKAGYPVLPDESTMPPWHGLPNPHTPPVLASNEQIAVRNALDQLSHQTDYHHLPPIDRLALPPGPYPPRLGTTAPQITQ